MSEGSGRRRLVYDVVVIGSGLAGLTAAAGAASGGARVGVVAASSGNLGLWSGLIGSGRSPSAAEEKALHFFADFSAGAGLPYDHPPEGRTSFSVLSPSGRPVSCRLAPASASAGDIASWAPAGSGNGRETLLVGFTELTDYPVGLLASRAAVLTGQSIIHRSLSLGPTLGRGLAPRLAHLFDDRTWFESFLELSRRFLAPELRTATVVGFPPVLGFVRFTENLAALESCLGRPVFELPALPPSVPGDRFRRLWRHRLESRFRVSFHLGRTVLKADFSGRRCFAVEDGRCRYEAGGFVLATGGVAGGGLTVSAEDFLKPAEGRTAGAGAGTHGPIEPVFGLRPSGRGRDWSSWGVARAPRTLENVRVAGWQEAGRPRDAMASVESGAWAGFRAAEGLPGRDPGAGGKLR